MSPWFIAVPVATILLIFLSVIAAAGVACVVGPICYLIRSIVRRDWQEFIGVITLGTLIALFGWVIVTGSVDAGGAIIEGLITRISG